MANINKREHMKKFYLERYLENPKQKIVTRTGKSVRIICTNADSEQCVIGLVRLKEEEAAFNYYKDGRHLEKSDSNQDLFFATEKKNGWINVYKDDEYERGCRFSGGIFNTKEEALEHLTSRYTSVDTVKIEWEEQYEAV